MPLSFIVRQKVQAKASESVFITSTLAFKAEVGLLRT